MNSVSGLFASFLGALDALPAIPAFGEQASTATRGSYTVVVVVIALLRLVELRVASRNTRDLRSRGAIESGAGHYPWMVTLHSLFLVSCLAEVWLLERGYQPWLTMVCAVILVAAAALRWWVVRTLEGRWTTRVLVLPGTSPIVGGPFRWLRHPNYIAVVAEIAALPLLHGAWLTALIFTAANLWLLRVRIGVEEAALRAAKTGPGGWQDAFSDRPRWIPRRK